jgi:hypothetical protein
MDADFLNAALPEPYTLLGVRLRPFCIGHALLLARHGLDPVRDTGGLVLAVVICAHRPEEFERVASSRLFRIRLAWWRLRLGRFDVVEKIALLNDYMAANTLSPKCWETDGKTFNPGAPFLQHLKITLQSRLNYSPSEALNAPLGAALWDYFSFWEAEGQADILSEQDKAMFNLAETMRPELDRVAKLHFN